MNVDDFLFQYWKYYLMIEKEFKSTIKYISIDKICFSAYSDVYAKILLQIGSEVDIVCKAICKIIRPEKIVGDINGYAEIIHNHFTRFNSVSVLYNDQSINPWKNWSSNNHPVWWDIYNGVKHNRTNIEKYGECEQENYKFANQENTMNALAGLYQLEHYLYDLLEHDPDDETPLPGSRLFILTGNEWNNRHFGKDSLVYVKTNDMIIREAKFYYSDV